jgi:hypothetical protein
MAEYLVVSHPKQFEYHGTLDDVDAAYAHGASFSGSPSSFSSL